MTSDKELLCSLTGSYLRWCLNFDTSFVLSRYLAPLRRASFFCCVVCHLSLHTTTAIIIHFAVNAVSVSLLSSLPFSADISLQSSAIRLSTTKHTASNVQPFIVLMCLRLSPILRHMRVSSWCIVLWLGCRRISDHTRIPEYESHCQGQGHQRPFLWRLFWMILRTCLPR